MEISVKLDKDFERYFNVLKEEFGEDFSIINGLSDDKLSYSDFLDNFVSIVNGTVTCCIDFNNVNRN